MPIALTNAPERPSPPQPPRKLWTREEIAAFEATGLWTGQHLELIEGELISKMGKKPPHVEGVARMTRRLQKTFDELLVYSEAPIDVSPQDNPTSQPEPDVIVMRPAFAGFRPTTPQPGELALVVEVADTTLAFDLTVKAALYARAGIQDYWVLDLNGRRLIVHRRPEAGSYHSIVVFGEGESVSPLGAPDRELLVREVLL